LPLIVEVEDLTQLTETLELPGINRVLCDNFSIVDVPIAGREWFFWYLKAEHWCVQFYPPNTGFVLLQH
jgi:hypothetical protein